MAILALGLNHTTAPLALRERVAMGVERVGEALHDLKKRNLVREAAILSTCNRTELYANTERAAETAAWLAETHQLEAQKLAPHLYRHPEQAAVRHAFRVASGLDSMVLGEPQILGQMKEAVRIADAAGTLDSTLHQLFQKSFSVAKEVRSSTAIGAASVSMAAAAVKLAQRIYPSVGEVAVLFVGAGEMIELCATHFAAHSPKRMTVANRTVERAEGLAARFSAHTMRLAELPAHLHEYDIVVSCTASSLPIIGLGAVERAIKARRRKPMLMVDLAVPRDIEPEVSRLDDVFLYTVDDLAALVQEGRSARMGAVAQAEGIIDSEVQGFMQWMASRDSVPTIKALRDQAEGLRRAELERAMKRLAAGDDAQSVLEALSNGLTNKLMHAPTVALTRATQAGEGAQDVPIQTLIKSIYQL